jgi:phage shock protein E
MIDVLKRYFGAANTADFKALVESGAIVVDVRTQGEFREGHIAGSLNIPLDQIKSKLTELKKKNKPIITCCRSGSRSAIAKSALQSAGIECYNGGPWNSLNGELKKQ